MLCKSKSLTLVTIGYSWIHSWDILIEYCFWAQEAVCNKVIDVGTGFMKILYLGRAPRTKETLPDFREKCRVTRHSRAFRWLTGSQRTPGFWGVTTTSITNHNMKLQIPPQKKIKNKKHQTIEHHKQITTSTIIIADYNRNKLD